jgi:hypothetical protein
MTRPRCGQSASENSRRARHRAPAKPDRPPNQTAAKIRRYRRTQPSPHDLGYLDAELPSGMILNGRKLMRGPTGEHWIAWLTVRLPLMGRIR